MFDFNYKRINEREEEKARKKTGAKGKPYNAKLL